MYKLFMSGAILSLLTLSLSVNAQTTDANTAPTEVGTTTMPPGQYSVTDQGNGKKYALMVTSKGTMILGPATAAATTTTTTTTKTTATSLQGLAETQMKKGVTNMIEKQGMNQIKGLIK